MIVLVAYMVNTGSNKAAATREAEPTAKTDPTVTTTDPGPAVPVSGGSLAQIEPLHDNAPVANTLTHKEERVEGTSPVRRLERGFTIAIRHPDATAKARPTTDPDTVWVPPGRSTTVRGYTIPNGMLYVGEELRAVDQWRGNEPALIDPRLPVDSVHPDLAGEGLHYWPSYAGLPPASRAAYLLWLSGGRSDPKTNIGYVFLFFYGLERRLLADVANSPAAILERCRLLAEVERLLTIYEHPSFRSYAGALVDCLKASDASSPARTIPPTERSRSGLPSTLRVALAQLAQTGRPVPAAWAWSWINCHPEMIFRIPAARCAEEFRRLFEIRYKTKFGDGMVIKPNRTRLRIVYRPASASFAATVEIPVPDLPDVTAVSGPFNRLRELAHSCMQDLDAYSRYLGRNSAGRGTLAATALLPRELADSDHESGSAHLRRWIESTLQGSRTFTAPADDVLRFWPCEPSGKVSKTIAVGLSQLLEKLGYGIEPDVRFGGPPFERGSPVVLFRLPRSAPDAPTPFYSAATALLHIGAMVADADDAITPEEERQLETHLETSLDLSSSERERLRAHLAWLLIAKPGMSGLKKRLETLGDAQRAAVRGFLVRVAGTDGHFSREEIGTLTKLYKILGFTAADVYSDVHSVTTGVIQPAAEPVTVQKRDANQTAFGIPPAPAETAPGHTVAPIRLDLDRIEQKLAETSAVSALLADIFIEDEPSHLPAPPPESVTRVAGLDSQHSAFARALSARAIWTRGDLESLAATFRLLPDGAIDTINEAALEHWGDALCDGDDPIEINAQIAQELIA